MSNNQTSSFVEPTQELDEALPSPNPKKPFVEPVISVPVDVLEATSFFQAAQTVDTGDI